MNSSFGIIQSVLCSSPVRPIAPGCVYGEAQAIPIGLQTRYALESKLSKLDQVALGPQPYISVREGQEIRRKKDAAAAAAGADENGAGLHPLVYVGGLGAAVALGVGIFIYIRKRRQG